MATTPTPTAIPIIPPVPKPPELSPDELCDPEGFVTVTTLPELSVDGEGVGLSLADDSDDLLDSLDWLD